MALATSSCEGKNMFIWLAREELAHMRLFEEMLREVGGGAPAKPEEEGYYELIQARIDYATQTGFWFGIREFNIEAA